MSELKQSRAASADEAMQGAETHARRTRGPDREVKAGVWTERMSCRRRALSARPALESGVKGGKWFSLMDKVFAPNTLAMASCPARLRHDDESPCQQRRGGCGWAKHRAVRGTGG